MNRQSQGTTKHNRNRLRKWGIVVFLVGVLASPAWSVTWNDNVPLQGNQLADDLTDMNENFTYLHTLIENYYKSLSDSSADIGKNALYFVDSTEPDQGKTNATAGMDRGVKELLDAIGLTKKAVLVFSHKAADANTTTYQFATETSIPANITVYVEPGALLDTRFSVRTASYRWTLTGSGTAEYRLETSAGADPGLSDPTFVYVNGAVATEGAAGSLAAGEWDYSGGYLIVRLSDGTDPDSKAADYVKVGYTLTFATGSHITDNGGQMFDAAAGEVVGLKEANPVWWGADSAYTTDSTTAFQAAHDALTVSTGGRFIVDAGIWKVQGLKWSKSDIEIVCDGWLKPASDTTTPVIYIGRNTSNQTVNTARLRGSLVVGDPTGTHTSWSDVVGVQIESLLESTLTITARAMGVGVGLYATYNAGAAGISYGIVSYNTLTFGNLLKNHVAVKIDPQDASSWVNENTYIGGRYGLSGATWDATAWNIYISNGNGNIPNDNMFLRPSLENAAGVYMGGLRNAIKEARWEPTTTGTAGTDFANPYWKFDDAAIQCEVHTAHVAYDLTTTLLYPVIASAYAFTYSSDRVMTIAADNRDWFPPGQLIKITQTVAAVDYYYYTIVTQMSYSAPTLTVRIADAVLDSTATAIKVQTIPLQVVDTGSSASPLNRWTFANWNTKTSADVSLGYSQAEVMPQKRRIFPASPMVISGLNTDYPALTLVPNSSASEKAIVVSSLTDKTFTMDHNGNIQIKNTVNLDKSHTNLIFIEDDSGNDMLRLKTNNSGGGGYNAADAVLYVTADTTTSRAINAGGSVNASGADYAEWMYLADGVKKPMPGTIVGIDAQGKITDKWIDSISFAVISTNPAYVGGDTWASDMEIPKEPPDGEDQVEHDKYKKDKNKFYAELATREATVVRVAYCGQVPIEVQNVAKAGDWIVPEQAGQGIQAVAISRADMTLDRMLASVGQVLSVIDGAVTIAVRR